MLKTNSQLDERRQTFWENYLAKNTPTYSNGYKSALISGFTEHTARNITRKKWFRLNYKIISDNFNQRVEKYIASRMRASY